MLAFRILVLLITLSRGPSVYAKDGCAPELSPGARLSREVKTMTLFGRTHAVTVVTGGTARTTLERVIPDLADGDLVIGAEAGHVYVMYKHMRYDGSVPGFLDGLIGNAKFRRTILNPADGLLVHLSGLPAATIADLDELFACERRERSVTCATGARSIVTRAGIAGLGPWPTLTGNLLLSRLLKPKDLHIDGVPIRRAVYTYNLPNPGRQQWFDRVFFLAYAVPIGTVAGLIYHFSH